ncbi:hypothetical protein C3L33_01280, partial [Rhododendron williamsianum]
MATNSPDAKWAHPRPTEIEQDEIEEEGEEEEALSLCDLPINNQQNHQPTKEEEEAAAARPIKPEEDFDFKSLIGSVLTHHKCALRTMSFSEAKLSHFATLYPLKAPTSAGPPADQKEKGKTKKEKKQTVSRHRTFEWLKELSNAGAPD